MAARLTVLSSGSKGNSAVVGSARTSVLVDAGLSCRETFRRMRAAGEEPEKLDAILISHEHSDHVTGLEVLARKTKAPVYMTADTHEAWMRDRRQRAHGDSRPPQPARVEFFSAGHSFVIGDVTVTPFTTPHDAADPVAFTFRVEGVKLGLVTDLGYLPPNVR